MVRIVDIEPLGKKNIGVCGHRLPPCLNFSYPLSTNDCRLPVFSKLFCVYHVAFRSADIPWKSHTFHFPGRIRSLGSRPGTRRHLRGFEIADTPFCRRGNKGRAVFVSGVKRLYSLFVSYCLLLKSIVRLIYFV